MKHKKFFGFTLVELLVVISIMGILTVIVASNFVEAQKKSRDVKRKADLASISKALNMYYNDYDKFPSNQAGEPDINNLLQNGGEFSQDNNIYMKEVPVDKSSNVTRYTYYAVASGKSFRLWANLENINDKDCVPSDIGIGYVITTGCRYAVFSSNLSVGSSLL